MGPGSVGGVIERFPVAQKPKLAAQKFSEKNLHAPMTTDDGQHNWMK
jgi:hypothetical protein